MKSRECFAAIVERAKETKCEAHRVLCELFGCVPSTVSSMRNGKPLRPQTAYELALVYELFVQQRLSLKLIKEGAKGVEDAKDGEEGVPYLCYSMTSKQLDELDGRLARRDSFESANLTTGEFNEP